MRHLLFSILVGLGGAACSGSDDGGNGGGQTDEDEGGDDTATPQALMVSGTVVTSFAQLRAGVPVTVWSAEAGVTVETTTDADGHFSAANIFEPYDVVVTSRGVGTLFVGVTGETPSLGMFYETTQGEGATSVTVTGALDIAADTYTLVTVAVRDAVASTFTANATYQITMPLSQTPEMSAAIRGLRYSADASNVPTAYSAYGERAVVLSATESNDYGIPTSAISTRSVAFSGASPSGALATNWNLFWTPAATSWSQFGRQDLVDGEGTAPVPDDSRISMTIRAGRSETSGAIEYAFQPVASDSSSYALTLPEPLLLSAPADVSLDLDATTTFTSAEVADATYHFQLETSEGVRTVVVSATPSFDAAKLEARGLGLAASTQYDWFVLAIANTSQTPWTVARTTYAGALRAESQVSQSASRSFTTR